MLFRPLATQIILCTIVQNPMNKLHMPSSPVTTPVKVPEVLLDSDHVNGPCRPLQHHASFQEPDKCVLVLSIWGSRVSGLRVGLAWAFFAFTGLGFKGLGFRGSGSRVWDVRFRV